MIRLCGKSDVLLYFIDVVFSWSPQCSLLPVRRDLSVYRERKREGENERGEKRQKGRERKRDREREKEREGKREREREGRKGRGRESKY